MRMFDSKDIISTSTFPKELFESMTHLACENPHSSCIQRIHTDKSDFDTIYRYLKDQLTNTEYDLRRAEQDEHKAKERQKENQKKIEELTTAISAIEPLTTKITTKTR